MKLVNALTMGVFLTSCEATPAAVEIYCPQFPEISDEERDDLATRIPPTTPAYGYFKRLIVLKAELDACKEQEENAGD